MRTLITALWVFLSALYLSAADELIDFDFKSKPLEDAWNQANSGYYKPLGKVEKQNDGLAIATNGKTENMIQQKQKFSIKPGDQIEFKIKVKCSKDTPIHFGVMEFQSAAFLKSDLLTEWVKAPGGEITKTVTTKFKDKPFDQAAIIFGVAKNHEAVIESVSARMKAPDEAQLAAELPKGIVMHLDASNAKSVETDKDRVSVWRDISGSGNDVSALTAGSGPTLVSEALNKRNMLRFEGKQELKMSRSLELPNGLSIFMVFKRDEAQKGGETWQDGLYWGTGENPERGGKLHLTLGENSGAQPPLIVQHSSQGPFKNLMLVGSNAGKRGFVHGDIGEIIIFNRTDLSSEEVEKVRNYLLAKWNFNEDDYVRFGPLPSAPKRISDKLPLSDQTNLGKWTIEEACSDEFNGSALDRTKWVDQTFYNLGRPPTRALPDNVVLEDGMLNLISKYDPEFSGGRLKERGPEYHSFTVGNIFSRFHVRYGYIEVRSKMQASSFSSTFWLIGGGVERATGKEGSPEIDVYELGAKSLKNTYNYNMCLHYAQRKPAGAHPSHGQIWKSNFKFTDDFHVYGVEWTPTAISWYIDGSLVRKFKVKDNMWDMGMTVNISTESQFGWFGIPDVKDLPSTYAIDYVRVWKNPETTMSDDWLKKYDNQHVMKDSGFAFDYYAKNGTKFVGLADDDSKAEHSDLNALENEASAANWKTTTSVPAKWNAKITPEGLKGLLFHFDPTMMQKDGEDAQLVIPSSKQPRYEFDASTLNEKDLANYKFLAVYYYNPEKKVQEASFSVNTENGASSGGHMLMKYGKGVTYIKINGGGKIKSFGLTVPDGVNPSDFYLTRIRLEK